jgi:hypothetical protein
MPQKDVPSDVIGKYEFTSTVCELCGVVFEELLENCKICHATVCPKCDKATVETGPVCSICNQKGCTE